jgi:hypothetical protein
VAVVGEDRRDQREHLLEEIPVGVRESLPMALKNGTHSGDSTVAGDFAEYRPVSISAMWQSFNGPRAPGFEGYSRPHLPERW